MVSTIDPTKPLDGAPASKAELRTNLQAAKDEIEALQVPVELGGESGFAGTTLTLDGASFGTASEILIRCISSSPVTITLAADVPFGKGVHVVQYGSGAVTATVASIADVIDGDEKVIAQPSVNPKLWGGAKKEQALSDELGVPVFSLPAPQLLKRCLQFLRTPYPFASLAYARSLYQAVEGYGGNRLINPDKWFVWKLLSVADTAYYIDAPLFAYRWHSSNQAAQQNQSGALKHLIDQYVTTFDVPASVLARAGLTRADLVSAFVEQDVALRGLLSLAEGQRVGARRVLRFGQAAYPDEARRNLKVALLRGLLLAGPLGTQLARIGKGPALRLWTRGQAREAGASAADRWLQARSEVHG